MSLSVSSNTTLSRRKVRKLFHDFVPATQLNSFGDFPAGDFMILYSGIIGEQLTF